LRATLAELRLRARQRLSAARDLLASAPQDALPALLPVALVRPALDRMERRRYQPFSPPDIPQWRRQWILWRAARSGLLGAF
jgi:phytoene synthase